MCSVQRVRTQVPTKTTCARLTCAFQKLSIFRTFSLANFISMTSRRPLQRAPHRMIFVTSNNSPDGMTWRSPMLHLSHLQFPVQVRSPLVRIQTTPVALFASIARLMLAHFTTALHPILPTPSNGRSLRPLHVTVASVRNGCTVYRARSSSVSTKVTRPSILLPFYSHLCLFFTCLIPTAVSLVHFIPNVYLK